MKELDLREIEKYDLQAQFEIARLTEEYESKVLDFMFHRNIEKIIDKRQVSRTEYHLNFGKIVVSIEFVKIGTNYEETELEKTRN